MNAVRNVSGFDGHFGEGFGGSIVSLNWSCEFGGCIGSICTGR